MSECFLKKNGIHMRMSHAAKWRANIQKRKKSQLLGFQFEFNPNVIISRSRENDAFSRQTRKKETHQTTDGEKDSKEAWEKCTPHIQKI